MSLDADVVILGGGCAGLSLAVALAQHAPRLRVLTLEQRASYTRDRTWCFWNSTDHPFRAGVTREWNAWRVRAGGKEVRQQSKQFCYQHLPADNFYSLAQQQIASARQELLLDTHCGEVRSKGGTCVVDTNQGMLHCRWLFDARTPRSDAASPLLWQRFLGWHVRSERPCFDPECVDLMDFQTVREKNRAAFFYVLPFSKHEALVEITYLDPPSLQPEAGRARLCDRLRAACPEEDYEILYEETGALPMGQTRRPVASEHGAVPIGMRGGRVKASSGYAFQRIQRQSQALAQALGRGDALPRHFEPRLYSVLDEIFLAALRQRPERIPSYFFQLFQRVAPDALVPFLSETANTGAVLSTMLALPKWDFLQAALHSTKRVAA